MKSCKLDLYITAHNRVDLLKEQYRLLNKYLIDDFNYIICDNSYIEKRESIEYFANNNNIRYINLPTEFLTYKHCNENHGHALNWVFKNIISKSNTEYFGLLDHDTFPLREVSILEKINNKVIYGAEHDYQGDGRWYLFPGFCFFNLDYVRNIELNFLWSFDEGATGSWGDTGASNWYCLYKDLDKSLISLEEWMPNMINEHVTVHHMGENWLHLGSGSFWLNDKYNYCMELLNNL